MKKITILICLTLFINLLNAQTITEFSSGYTSLEGIAINSNNEVYVSEHDSGKIYKLDSSGNQTLIATAGGFANDMVFDTNDNLYVAEPFTNKISVVDNTTGVMSEYISTFSIGNSPYGIEYYDGLIYFASETSAKVIQINSDLTTSDYATGFFIPEGIAFDSDGNLYVADRSDRKLFKITPTGTKTTIASNIKNIRGVTVSPTNIVYFTMYNNFPLENKIMKYDPTTGNISDFVTTSIDEPRSIEIDNLGNMYVTNIGDGTVTKIYDDSLLPTTSDIVNIPDANFKNILLGLSDINTNGDSEIQTSEAQIYTGSLPLSNSNISDLTGIEAFNQITSLNCFGNQLTALDISFNIKLEELICFDNMLTNLNIINNTALIRLSCQRNQITSLDVSANTLLEILSCDDNQLTTLDVSSNTLLEYINLATNLSLSVIDVTSNTELTYLNIMNNNVSSLDLSSNIKLTFLNIDSNDTINMIDLSNNTLLEEFRFNFVSLTELDLSNNNSLVYLLGSSTNLTTVDLRNGNNSNMTYFAIYNANNLSCIFVDDKDYSDTNWTNIPTNSNFVETEAECTSLSIDDFQIANFKIYPNPTSTILNINIPFKKAIIYNIQGKEIMKSYKQTINIENLLNGVYFIQFDNSKNKTFKFIKE